MQNCAKIFILHIGIHDATAPISALNDYSWAIKHLMSH